MRQFIQTLLLVLLSMIVLPGQHAAAQSVSVLITDGYVPDSVKANMEAESGALLSAFNQSVVEDGKKLKDKLSSIFKGKTPREKALIKSVMTLWKSSPIACCDYELEATAIKMYGNRGYQMRDVPVEVLDADEDNEFQYLVLNFDTEGHMTDVNMSIELHNYRQVICENIPEEDYARRMVILDFIEVFRTAYNRKDLEYLRQVYSDDVLIIDGIELKKKNADNNQMMGNLGNVEIEYQQRTKKEYLDDLKRTFNRNAYINIRFEEVSVIKHSKRNNIYGVTLKQYWNSSTEDNVGWLFLMINFEDALNPSIEVRTWQPEKFKNGMEATPRDKVFSLYNFNLD